MNHAIARRHMVDSQVRPDNVTDARLIAAMAATPRERFVPSDKQAVAYSELELKVSDGRCMLSPRDFAKLVDAADIKPDDAVLDVACGLGYSTAVLARLAETVVALESDQALAEAAEKELSEVGADNTVVLTGDVVAGSPDQGPFNVIVVEGALETEPSALKSQLADGGRLVYVARRGAVGEAVVVLRTGDHFGERVVFNSSAAVLPEFRGEKEFVF